VTSATLNLMTLLGLISRAARAAAKLRIASFSVATGDALVSRSRDARVYLNANAYLFSRADGTTYSAGER
jgi:hypothetical protein